MGIWWNGQFVFGHRSPGPASLHGHHENHLIWVDSSLMALVIFSLVVSSFECLRPPPHSGPASLPGHHESHLIWVDSSLMAPFKSPLASAYDVQPPRLTALRIIWSGCTGTQSQQSPMAFIQFFPLSSPWASFVGQSLDYCILCINCIPVLFTFIGH